MLLEYAATPRWSGALQDCFRVAIGEAGMQGVSFAGAEGSCCATHCSVRQFDCTAPR